MNILILCAGRRAKVIQYFKQEFEQHGGWVYAADLDTYAPATYFAKERFHVCRIDAENYIDDVLGICERQRIDAVLSLIDPELEILARNRRRFEAQGVQLILSSLPMVEMTFDKYAFHRFLTYQGLPSVPTYGSPEEAVEALDKGEAAYPLIMKPALGSGSIGIDRIVQESAFIGCPKDVIFQPFFKEKEFGVDVYVDLLTGELTDMFIKEKLSMRAGETDKSVAVHNREIEKIVIDLIQSTDFRGPLDIDLFEYNGLYYISEMNPRFGGGYPHAYECGVNFPRYILNNLNGIPNGSYRGFTYEEGKIMMKFDDVMIV